MSSKKRNYRKKIASDDDEAAPKPVAETNKEHKDHKEDEPQIQEDIRLAVGFHSSVDSQIKFFTFQSSILTFAPTN